MKRRKQETEKRGREMERGVEMNNPSKGYSIDSEGIIRITGDIETAVQALQPYYFSKICDHYYAHDTSPAKLLSDYGPSDVAKKRKLGMDKKELGRILRNIAPSVVAVSTFLGFQRLVDCSGLIIGWDASNGEVTILTSARLLRIPNEASRKSFYVAVRLANGRIVLAEEDYVDFYHNMLTLKIKLEEAPNVAVLNPSELSLEEGMEIIALGRDFFGCFMESSGILHLDYPYFGCLELTTSTCAIQEICEGGPLITTSGHVCGMSFSWNHYAHPLPVEVIKGSLERWSTYGTVVRPWVGLTVMDSDDLSPDAWQKLCLPSDIRNTVIVKQVFENSPANELGVKPGDFIVACGDSSIVSVQEYSRALCDISQELSAFCAHQTLDSAGEFMVAVERRDSGVARVSIVKAENVPVHDTRLFSCWLDERRDRWYAPKFGSQKNPPYSIFVNPNPPSWATVAQDQGVHEL